MTTRAWIPLLAAACFLSWGAHAARAQEMPAQPEKQEAAPPEKKEAAPPDDARARVRDTGPEVIVHLKDGRSLTGLLVRESPEGEVVIRIAGIETPIPTKTIETYQILPPILERYRQYRSTIGDDVDQILLLIGWLQAREQFELGLLEAEHVLKLDPHNKQALALKKALESQIELRDNAKTKPEPAGEKAASPARTHEPRELFPLLSESQINLIKVFEIDMDHPPRLVIERATVTKLLEEYAGNPLIPATQEGRDALYRKPPLEILDLMFRLRARDLYGEVQVLDQPPAMRRFRDEVQAGWLVNTCATNACHGGTEAGRLMLLNRKPRSEASVYTNFLILDRFRLKDGTALINYEAPERSALLQMGLPRADSQSPHPEVARGQRGRDAWRPAFRNTSDRGFTEAVEWIRAMYRPRPEYPIEYRPPGESVAPAEGKKEPPPR